MPNVGPYIYDVSISGFIGAPYMYEISSLRVNVFYILIYYIDDEISVIIIKL